MKTQLLQNRNSKEGAVLESSFHIVPGSILLFDDFNAFDKDDNHGERRALKEFEIANPKFIKKHLYDFGWHGTAFMVESV